MDSDGIGSSEEEQELDIRLNDEIETEPLSNAEVRDSDEEMESKPRSERSSSIQSRLDCLESEVEAVKSTLRQQLKALEQMRAKQRSDTGKGFKVPRDHPKFDGSRTKLEEFVLEMELSHSEYTTEAAARQHKPEFITQLVSYFEHEARTWFRLYASRRNKNKLELTWTKLVRDLRKDFGGRHEAETRFNEFLAMKQRGDVNTYISRKTEAALLAEADLTPRTRLFGFLSGLRADVQEYVRLQCPKKLSEAEELARAYENSQLSRKRKISQGSSEELTSAKKKHEVKSHDDERPPEQQRALAEIRAMRKHKCFDCGHAGHRKEDCSADDQTKKAFQDKIDMLKGVLRGRATQAVA